MELVKSIFTFQLNKLYNSILLFYEIVKDTLASLEIQKHLYLRLPINFVGYKNT